MEAKIVAVLNSPSKAREAVDRLINAGIPENSISVLYRPPRRAKKVSVRREELEIEEHPPAEETITESTAGAILGGIAGLLAGLTSVIVPEVGIVYIAGALATAVAGATLGAIGGGLIGALRDLGLTDEEVHGYLASLDAGAAVILIDTTQENFSKTEEVLAQMGVTDIHVIRHETKKIHI
jgi:uncharacterized membrane protein